MALQVTVGTACSHRSVANIEGRLPIPPGTRAVRVEVQNGSIHVVAGTEPIVQYLGGVRRSGETAELLAEVEGVSTDFTAAPDPAHSDILIVRAPSVPAAIAGRAFLAVEVQLQIPAELELEVQVAGSGHLEAEDRKAPVRLQTRRGDLRVMRCSGAANLRTDTGMTIVYDHRGDLDVEAKLGDMQAFVREPGKRVRLVTGQGNVQCFVPPTCGFRLDARAQTGKVANGFGVPLERDGYTSWMVGDRGDAATQIVLRTESGHLSLSHKTFE